MLKTCITNKCFCTVTIWTEYSVSVNKHIKILQLSLQIAILKKIQCRSEF